MCQGENEMSLLTGGILFVRMISKTSPLSGLPLEDHNPRCSLNVYFSRTWSRRSHMVVNPQLYCTRKCGCECCMLHAAVSATPQRFNRSGSPPGTRNFLNLRNTKNLFLTVLVFKAEVVLEYEYTEVDIVASLNTQFQSEDSTQEWCLQASLLGTDHSRAQHWYDGNNSQQTSVTSCHCLIRWGPTKEYTL